MSKHSSSNTARLERGLEALQSSQAFRGPVELLDGHGHEHANDHFALIYESREEQFAAAIPFIRQGLERGERCLYIVYENSRDEVVEAMRDYEIDVDAALDSGQLSIHDEEETYLRNGTFDADETIEFLDAAIEEATEEYEAFRVTGEMSSVLEEDPEGEDLVKCEAKANYLFDDVDGIALCQYNRERFPADVIRDVISTHPLLVHDNRVSYNAYYTPPGEFFGPEKSDREVDRLLGALRDQTDAKATLQQRERYLRESYEITSDPTLNFEEKLDALFELGCEQFGLDLGALNRVDPDADRLEVEYASGEHSYFDVGTELPLSQTYCQAAVEIKGAVHISNPEERGFDDLLVYEDSGVDGYLGTYIPVEGGADRTLAFAPDGSREEPFSERDRAYVELMGQWVGYELNRRQREQFLRESYEITSDPTLDFEGKLERLLDLGRERMALDAGGLTHLPSWEGKFRNEYLVGYGDDAADESGEVWTDPGEGCFCRQVIAEDEPVGMADVRGTEWEDDEIHQEHGLTCYLGTKVTSGPTTYGTLWVGSTEPRDREFSETERTFLELIGQWVSYEIEHREHKHSQQDLYEITADPSLETDEKVQRLLEVGCERLDLSVGMLNRDHGNRLEIKQMHGTHPDMGEGGLSPPSSKYYCSQVVETGEPVAVADAGAAGWEGDPLYGEAGLESYAGIRVTVGDDAYGTLCFADTSPREAAFTETEQAFLELMAQCVGYELERTRRETRLHALSAIGQELMTAETAAEVAEGVVAAAADTIDHSVTAVALYDDEAGELRPTAHTDAAAELVEAPSLIGGPDSHGWNAFIASETVRVHDSLDRGDTDATPELSVSEAVIHPLGTHGVLLTGTPAPDGFRRGDPEIIETAATNIRAALDRVDREQQLQERERALAEQNETLERLNRVNDTIRRIDQALVEASTREEIERVVCEELADAGPYELAWIGDHDAAAGEITFRESAGAEQGYLDAITITADDSPEGCGPGGRAVKTGEPQVSNDVLTDESFTPWRQDALNRGYHAVAALPLIYEDTRYGVLTLYAGQPGMFDALEQEVLAELSATIAHAINAVESKKALVSDEVTELEFTVTDRDLEVVELVRELQCEYSLKRLLPQSDGNVRAFFSTQGAPAADVLKFEPRLAVTDMNLISDPGDESSCLFEATLSEDSLSRTVLDHGGRLRAIDVEAGTATVVVHLAAAAEVREFVEMFQSKYPGSELDAQRTVELSQQTSLEFAAALTDDLTDRQEEVLQTAYFSGYFEEPRTRNASEIAGSMDITQPTFTSHLRTALRKLCRQVYESDPASA